MEERVVVFFAPTYGVDVNGMEGSSLRSFALPSRRFNYCAVIDMNRGGFHTSTGFEDRLECYR